MNNLGCKVDFENKSSKIYDTNGNLIKKGDQTRSNLFYLDIENSTCLIAKFDDVWKATLRNFKRTKPSQVSWS